MLIDEDVPDYWIQLGQLNLQLGNYRAAYDALSHAHELDRSNVEVVATMAQLAIYAGQIDLADQQAKNLALIAPDNSTVTLVQGFVALQQQNYEKAEAAADKLLAATPTDPVAKVLKARILIGQQRPDDAITLLEEQHKANSEDRLSLRALSKLYRREKELAERRARRPIPVRIGSEGFRPVAAIAGVGAESGQRQSGAPGFGPALLAADPGPSSSTQHARPLGAICAGGNDFARLLPYRAAGRTGAAAPPLLNISTGLASRLLAQRLLGAVQLPITHENASLNAVLAQSMALQGRTADANRLFNQVLSLEPDQLQALRGRSELLMRTGGVKQAIIDAQR